jgi:Tol biopolymer transport system component
MSRFWGFLTLLLVLLLAACNSVQNYVIEEETQITQEDWNLVSWSPDSSRLLLSRIPTTESIPQDGRFSILDIETNSLQLVSHPGIGAVWSPDSSALAIQSGGDNLGDIWLHTLADGESTKLDVEGAPIAWLADGRLIIERDDGLWSTLPDVSEVELEPILLFDLAGPNSWAVPAPDLNAILLYQRSEDDERRWWLVQTDGEFVDVGKPFYSIGNCCAWSADGKRFAFFSYEPELALYVVDSNGKDLSQVVATKDVGEGTFISMDFSPDGKTIAFEWSLEDDGYPFQNTQIYMVNVDGSGLRNLTPDSASHRWLQWSPDGRHIAFLGAQNEVWVAQLNEGN